MGVKVLRRLGAGTLVLFLLAGAVSAETYRIDPVHSSVVFSIRHIVSRVTGRFTDVSGTIVYDPAQVGTSRVQATIRVASIDTDNPKRDAHLRSPDFFNAEKYPEITFKSTGVKSEGNRLMVTGDLTVHGTTKQVVVPVEVLGTAVHPMRKVPVIGFAAELTIMRSDFGVNNWTDMAGVLGDEVRVMLNVEAVAEKASQAAGKK